MTDERYKQCKYYRGIYHHTPEDDPAIVGYCGHPLQYISTDHLVILCRGCPCEEYTPRAEDGKSKCVLGGIHEPPGMGNCSETPAWLRAYKYMNKPIKDLNEEQEDEKKMIDILPKEFLTLTPALCDNCSHFEEGCWCNWHRISVSSSTPACTEYKKPEGVK